MAKTVPFLAGVTGTTGKRVRARKPRPTGRSVRTPAATGPTLVGSPGSSRTARFTEGKTLPFPCVSAAFVQLIPCLSVQTSRDESEVLELANGARSHCRHYHLHHTAHTADVHTQSTHNKRRPTQCARTHTHHNSRRTHTASHFRTPTRRDGISCLKRSGTGQATS